jgi:glycosyltransferase involved in cell wall biosynthesis
MLNWRDLHNPKAGGAERVSQAFLQHLAERGHEIFWFSNNFSDAVRQERIGKIQVVRGGGMGSSIFHAISWYRKQKPFDLVIDQHHGVPWFAPWWCKTNCIAYIHEVLGPIWKSFYPWPLSQIGYWQEYWTHRLYRNIPFWVPSKSTRKNLLARGVKNVVVFPNGVDTTPLSQLDPKPLASPLKLITVCRLAPNKRVDHAIELLKILSDKNISAELTIVGRGEMENALREKASELDLAEKIRFTGSVSESEKNRFLCDAHLLVHTSVREGWGLNVLEANAMGTPALVYPVEGLVDSTIDGQTGFVTKGETPAALAKSIEQLLVDKSVYETIRLNAWNRSKEFQWEKVLPQVCDWLELQARKNSNVQ